MSALEAESVEEVPVVCEYPDVFLLMVLKYQI
jgi:hypothetical protein